MKTFSYARELKEVSMFFAGKDEVHKTLSRLIARLEKARIAYAIVGAMALVAHRYRRTTTDVDILLNAEGFAQFQELYVGKYYERLPRRPRRFVDRANRVMIDFLVTGMFPGSGLPGPIAYPEPRQVRQKIQKTWVIDLSTLVQLKLAARRWKDFADVVELIRHNKLDESFAEGLDRSVRNDYIECLEEKRREDLYEGEG